MDRDETLRRAEKLLRQGRLDAAIEEYARVVESAPDDLPTLNALGDLYVRAARSDLALPLYSKVADTYFREGFFSKAAGFYKKILKHHPRDESVLLRLAEVSATQKLFVEARAHYRAVARLREERGDLAGRDEIVVQVAGLSPTDLDSRFEAAGALARLHGPAAADTLRDLAADLSRHGREPDALAVLHEVLALDPGDRETGERLVRAALAAGGVDDARGLLDRLAPLDSPGLLVLLYDVELASGRTADAHAVAEQLLTLEPDNPDHQARLDRATVANVEPPPAVEARDDWTDQILSAVAMLDEDVEQAHGGEEADARLDANVEAGRLVETEQPAIWLADATDATLAVPDFDDHDLLVEAEAPGPEVEPIAAAFDAFFPDTPEDPATNMVDSPDAGPEVDLTPDLEALAVDATGAPGSGLAAAAGADALESSGQAPDLESVFTRWRDDARLDGEAGAAQSLAVGETYLAAGMYAEARRVLEAAAREAGSQFRACRLLAEIDRAQGRDKEAIAWLERAVEAPASEPEDRIATLRQLGALLEAGDEPARALAVWLEVQTLVADDPEVEARVARLAGSASGGGEPSTP